MAAAGLAAGVGGVNEPFDLMRLSLAERVFVKLRGDRELRGTLHAYDGHMNLIMSDVEETIYVVIDEDEAGPDASAGKVKVRERENIKPALPGHFFIICAILI